MPLQFVIQKELQGSLGRAGILTTFHGKIETPAFVTVATKATVKALTPEQVKNLGAQVVLANTYHLYLQPQDGLVRQAGGLHKFMHWDGPTMTDSGGFQVFSLGEAFGTSATKISQTRKEKPLRGSTSQDSVDNSRGKLMQIDEDGVNFRSHIDGSSHRFTPEKSIEIQHNIGADIIFAFDECTSPRANYQYQKEAMLRTHRWAKRSLTHHEHLGTDKQALFGIVQGGRFEDLRKESAKIISQMDFAGFGIGGSFDKADMDTAVGWVNQILPKEKPRHLLGIGEPSDLLGGIENGVDLFDCVAPTRMARNGTLHTTQGRININNTRFQTDFSPVEVGCQCYTCQNYSKAYLAHLFRAKEMLAGTLASVHNLYFINQLVTNARQAILENNFFEFKNKFLQNYYKALR